VICCRQRFSCWVEYPGFQLRLCAKNEGGNPCYQDVGTSLNRLFLAIVSLTLNASLQGYLSRLTLLNAVSQVVVRTMDPQEVVWRIQQRLGWLHKNTLHSTQNSCCKCLCEVVNRGAPTPHHIVKYDLQIHPLVPRRQMGGKVK